MGYRSIESKGYFVRGLIQATRRYFINTSFRLAPRTSIPMDADRDSIDELHQLAEYRRARKMLRRSGFGAVAFGIINVAIAIYWLQFSPVNFILLLVAGALLSVGIWEVAYPMAVAAIFDGIIAITLGLWNVFVTILNQAAGGPPHVHGILFTVFMFSWGISRFVMYPRFAAGLQETPEPESLRRLDRVVERIKKLKSSDSDDIVGFRVAAKFMKPQQDFKGQLGENAAIFIDKRGHDILVGHKDDVIIKVKGKVLIGKTLKASIQVAEHKLEGTISPESYQRYVDWKTRDEVVEAEFSDEDESGSEEGIRERRPEE